MGALRRHGGGEAPRLHRLDLQLQREGADPGLQAKVDGWVLDATLYVIDQYRTEVGTFIADTVAAWDPEETSKKIELAVGRDLQFIRINGTIMGALVGLALYGLSQVM